MNWKIDARDGVVLVTMRSNAVNKMNLQFLNDLGEALDKIDRDFPKLPLVLTADGSTFSAGLDFDYVFPMFERKNEAEIAAWFEKFKSAILRIYTLPRRTVAAINGNAFAGGLILALACDVRIAGAGKGKFAVNEIMVGIPMPATYAEIVRAALGTNAAQRAILDVPIYDANAALELGILHKVVPVETLLASAIEEARALPADCYTAYAISKKILQAPLVERFAKDIPALDRLAFEALGAPDSIRAQKAAFEKLKKKPSAAPG